MSFVTRFAPSPTGFLHLGHAFAAEKAFAAARAAKGTCLLRVEDIDRTRCRPAFTTALIEDLTWLGHSWPEPVRIQSEHFNFYQENLENLKSRGLIYRCFKTRKDILDDMARAPHGPLDPHATPYVGHPLSVQDEQARLSKGEPFAWRLSLNAAKSALSSDYGQLTFFEAGSGPDGQTGLIYAAPETAGDVVLGRKDVGIAYHLAVVLDDALQGVTHVVRGQDLFEATHIQRLLQALLGLKTPIYHHHPLIYGVDGKRLSKREGSPALRDLRALGLGPQDIAAQLLELTAQNKTGPQSGAR